MLVALIDGREVDSSSPEWLLETLARHLLKQPLDKRRDFLDSWDKKAPDLVGDLRASMSACHAAAKKSHRAPAHLHPTTTSEIPC